MPQTTYNLDNVAAVAGQVVEQGRVCTKYQASEEIPPGRLCELHTDGTLRLYRGGKRAGVSMYRSAKDPGAYAIDDFVPLLRSGQIWADFSGTTAADLADANVKGPDTTATNRGKFTDAAQSGAADAQVFNAGPVKFYGTGPSGLALVEVNFPADEVDGPAPQGTLPAHASNDFILPAANIVQGAQYEIGACDAASTVTLPAAAPDGTKISFVADGVANDQTVQYRDATGPTNLTTALVASKRHLVLCEKVNGKWYANAYVSP